MQKFLKKNTPQIIMEHIINHKRFKKIFTKEELNKYFDREDRIRRFPRYNQRYYNFFTNHTKENYKLVNNKCLCGFQNDILLSKTDRSCVNFITVVCKDCGLIRAKEYFRDEDLVDFHKNFFHTILHFKEHEEFSLNKFFDQQFKESKFRFELINENKIEDLINKKILDLGGGIGGALKHFDSSNELFLADFYDPYLNYAQTQGIKSIKGGLEEINFKPDVIILSHVIEHWSNFEREIKKLINIQKVGKTLNYIEFPGVDSIKKGRREGDILGDIFVPHVYYFSSYVFENLMNRYGFEKLYIDTLIKSIFIYTGKKKNLINYYTRVHNDLLEAEKTRKIQIIKNIIKRFTPKLILKLIRKIRNKKIKY